jgi:hypothetical protein
MKPGIFMEVTRKALESDPTLGSGSVGDRRIFAMRNVHRATNGSNWGETLTAFARPVSG